MKELDLEEIYNTVPPMRMVVHCLQPNMFAKKALLHLTSFLWGSVSQHRKYLLKKSELVTSNRLVTAPSFTRTTGPVSLSVDIEEAKVKDFQNKDEKRVLRTQKTDQSRTLRTGPETSRTGGLNPCLDTSFDHGSSTCYSTLGPGWTS